MRIGLYTWGSEGDVRPFVALAAGLVREGHDVALGYVAIDGRDWSATCEPLGVRSRAIGVEAVRLARTKKGPHDDVLVGKGNALDQVRVIVEALLDPVVEDLWADAQSTMEGLDVAVVHLLAHPVMSTAIARGVRLATVAPAPVTPSRVFPPMGAPDLGPFNPMTWWLADRVARRWLVPRINTFRVRAGLSPMTQMFSRESPEVALGLTCVSPTLVPRPTDWHGSQVVTGFFDLPAGAHAWRAPDELARFLDAGDAPWLMGFGSMLSIAGDDTAYCVRTMIEAVERAGTRALVQAPWDELPAMPASPRVMRLGRAPHADLLPRCRGMVHHGGAGTTQAACLAGRPSVIVPFLGDQFFWAERLRRLGLAPHAVPRKHLDAERLARAMRSIDTDPNARMRADDIARRMRTEDGVGEAVRRIEALR
ncbi:MAG: glycosyltransferase family 1 protein [Deltaproteobacteria bacterium]|nr:glycosyltransferase family 1 protein [Deltaproteobacteria bacterium]